MSKPVLLFFILFAALLISCHSSPIPTSVAPTATLPLPTATPPPTMTATPSLTPTPVPPTRTPTATPSPIPPVELHFWHSLSQQTALNALIDRFNVIYPDIRVIPIYVADTADLVNRVSSAKNAESSSPELVLAYPYDIAVMAKQGTVVRLDDVVKDPKTGFTANDLKDISPAFIDRYPQLGNGIYSLGFMRSMYVMFYNIDLLFSAGLTRPPETWDEFGKVCAATRPADVYCYEMDVDASVFMTWVLGRGGEMLSADGKTAIFDQKLGLDSMAWLDDGFRRKQALLASRAFQEPTDLAAGKVIFTFDTYTGLSFYDRAVKSAGMQVNWGIAPLPRSTKDPVAVLYGPSVAVTATSTEKQRTAALRFVKWLMDTDAGAEWVRATGYLPARQSTKTELADFLTVNLQMSKPFDWLPYSRGEPAVAGWNTIRGLIANAMSAVAGGKSTPDAALKDAVKKANDVLAGRAIIAGSQ